MENAMSLAALIYLVIAYGILWVVPLALLIVILVRLNRVSHEVEALRRRLDGAPGARYVSPDADREEA